MAEMGQAQEGRPATRALSASLLRKLAEAADGHRNTASEIFFVARYQAADDCYDVTGPYLSRQEAEAVAQEKNSTSRRENGVAGDVYGCFGPYQTEDDVRPRARIVRFQLEVQKKERRLKPMHIKGDQFDALFYSISALEKFVLPYYTRVHGPEYATRLRAEFVSGDLLLMGHLPNTEPESLRLPPGEEGLESLRSPGPDPFIAICLDGEPDERDAS